MNHCTYHCIKCGKPSDTLMGTANTCISCLTPSVIPPVKYPHVLLDSKVYDLYTIGDALGIHDHALFNAFKKIVRRGRGEKSERQDLEEAAFSIQRCLRDLQS